MAKETEEARERRKKSFISALKEKRCRELIEPLNHRIRLFFDGKTKAEDVFKTARHVGRRGEEITSFFKKRVDVILAGIAMEENLYLTEIEGVDVKVRKGDITVVFSDAVVAAANGRGVMSDGVAGAIKAAGGPGIEKEAVSKSPVQAGKAFATTAGSLANLHVIHAVIAEEPSGESSPDTVRRALSAALGIAGELGCETLAIPGMGTGAGKVSPDESAGAILDAIRSRAAGTPSDIILIDRSDGMVEAFKKALERYDEENE